MAALTAGMNRSSAAAGSGTRRSARGPDHRTSRTGPVHYGLLRHQDRPVLAAAAPGRPSGGRGVDRLGRHRAEDRVQAAAPRCRASCVPSPGHIPHHPARLRRAVRGVRAARLAGPRHLNARTRTRRFAKWSAICSFALGMARQVAYHLLQAQAGMARAPWPVTTIVSCLPVLVLAIGTALAHMLRADAQAMGAPDSGTGPPASLRSLSWCPEDQARPERRSPGADRDLSAGRDQSVPALGPQRGRGVTGPGIRPGQPQLDRPALSPVGLPRQGSPYHDEHCAAAESGALTMP